MKEKDYCRCCLSDDCDKDIVKEYFFAGTTEVYSKLLLDTFDINILQHEDTRSLICDRCIIRLRDAVSFKRQVLASQQNILKLATLMNTNVVVSNMALKTEDDADDFDDKVSVFNDSDFIWDTGTKDADGRIFAIKVEDKMENRIITPKKTYIETLSEKILSNSDTKAQTKCKIMNNSSDAKAKSKSNEKLPKLKKGNDRRKRNTLKLLENSNMCLFRSLRTKYGCYACKNAFLDIKTLRTHVKTHPNSKYITSKINHMRGLSYKNVDISDLKCNKCDDTCTDLVDLKKHLTHKHDIEFLNDDHFLIPFRLQDELGCVLCAQKFKTFTRLLIHMNSHYANNVCDVCGLSYINRLSLRTHQQLKHTEKKCNICAAILLSVPAKITHMRRVHNISREPKRYCNLCDKTFRYTYMLQEHKVKEHDFEKPPVLQCSECGKSFSAEVNLRTHMRAVHVRERNHPCQMCSMRFFTKCDRVRHERTHVDIKSFPCTYCDSKFKSKDSCRRHMRRQHGHVFESSVRHRHARSASVSAESVC